MQLTKKKNRKQIKPHKYISILDIGHSKVLCMIAKQSKEEGFKIIGMGHQASRGFSGGQIIHMNDAIQSISNAITGAERQANTTIETIVVNISGQHMMSEIKKAGIKTNQKLITEHEIHRLFTEIQAIPEDKNYELIHINPIDFSIDNLHHIQDPTGMTGQKLTGYFYTISIDKSALQNLVHALENCHVDLLDIHISQIASAEACLSEDERQLGATLIDFGSQSIDIASYYQNQVIFMATIPLGGRHITHDLASVLSTSVNEAERLKNIVGSATVNKHDHLDMINVQKINDLGTLEMSIVPKSGITQIIQPRVEEFFEHIAQALTSLSRPDAKNRIVLTGGSTNLSNMRDIALRYLGGHIRLGKAQMLLGLPEHQMEASYSTAIGMLALMQKKLKTNPMNIDPDQLAPKGFFKKISHWIKHHL